MINTSKPFAALVTNFKRKPFLLARLKLGAGYTIGMMLVLALFNLLVFTLFVTDVPDHLEETMPELEIAEERLEQVLYTADGIIFIIVALTSYALAGRALRPIKKSYEQQKKFVADAAHELRTPLAVIKIGAETTLNKKSNHKDYHEFTKDALAEVNYLSAIVDNLLILAKSDNSQKPDFTTVDLSALTLDQARIMHIRADDKDISVTENVSPGLHVSGNKDYLKRVLTNLISNAINYNKPQGIITISLKQQGKQVELAIADTGQGISDKDLPHVFSRFYATDQARTLQGSGLGLSIVKEIVEMHDGHISLQSQQNKGTTVTIIFPAA